MKIGLVGFGNMAMAIARGLLETGTVSPDQMVCSARNRERLEQNAGKYGIPTAENNTQCAAAADVVLLCVKPKDAPAVLQEIGPVLNGKLLVSIVAGLGFDRLKPLIPDGCHAVSVMPNMPVSVGQGILVVDENNNMTEEDKALLVRLFEPAAMLAFVPGAQMGIAGVLAGCAPAFVDLFMEALADAGVKYGLSRKTALDLAGKVVEGSGKLMLDSGKHPAVLKDEVCSPAGTTIRGICTLEKNGFSGDIIEAVESIMAS